LSFRMKIHLKFFLGPGTPKPFSENLPKKASYRKWG
jgi:hypothetical protein